jgi:hypothetical protein
MSERERLLQAIGSLPDADLVGLSDAAIVRVLAYIKTEAQRPAAADDFPQTGDLRDVLAFASQELDAYNQDYSEYLARFK